MKFSAKQIAKLIKGNIDGDKNAVVSGLSKIENGIAGTLSFLANPKYETYIYSTKATIVIVSKDFVPKKEIYATLIRVEDPYSSFAMLLEHYNDIKKPNKGISKLAYISETAKIGKNCYIGNFSHIGKDVIIRKNVFIYPQVFVGDGVKIGDNTTLYSGVKVYNDCKIGEQCTIHSGTIIGSDGFGFVPLQADNTYQKIIQTGNVIIEDYVEIGANCTIDRATLGSTIIKKGVKLDNLIQVAHNVTIGENTVIAAQSGISGSTIIGENCMFGGQVGITGHLTIGNNVKIASQSGVSFKVKDNSLLLGSPAFDVVKYRKSYVHFKNLDELVKKVDELEKKIDGKDNK